MLYYYAPERRERGSKRCFCPSVCSPVYLYVHPSVSYIANNSRTQRPSVPKFGRKVPHLRCDSHTSFKVKRSKVRVTDGRGHTVSAEPGGHTACYIHSCFVHCLYASTKLWAAKAMFTLCPDVPMSHPCQHWHVFR